jgi:hypothetical protein
MSPNETAPASGGLISVDAAAELIRDGAFLAIAGEERLLRELPTGNWIGGTTLHVMSQKGGERSRDRLFVTPIETWGYSPRIAFYDISALSRLCTDGPANGYSLIILPAFSAVHSLYARRAPEFEDMFVKPVIGWVAGCSLEQRDQRPPMVVNGWTGSFDTECAVVMHVDLPPDRYARIDIFNRFKQGTGDCIRFPETGFSVAECLVNGAPQNFAEYLTARGIDERLPLVANYSGAMINVSIKGIDRRQGRVDLYAPVFEEMEYRLAVPSAEKPPRRPKDGHVAFACNCILNYLNDGLEGHSTGGFTGPITFGEIAYLLLNQTLVYLSIEEVRKSEAPKEKGAE